MLFEVLLETHIRTREFYENKSKVDKSYSTTQHYLYL